MSYRPAWKAALSPWMPPDHDEYVVYAIRALKEGKANDGQQKLAFEYLMYLTGASEAWADLSFRPGDQGQRDTDFAEGKRFVGLMLRKLLHPSLTPKAKTETMPKTETKGKA